ncbi:MAG: translation initiation factor IF-2 [Clostridia bacterium]|nr:translation initiation factor IF-2 [Clostridia bacterium]
MAVNSQFKVNSLAKDLALKNKDLIDMFAEVGADVKTQTTLDGFQLDLMWENLTKANQITNIEDYIDGVTGIASIRKKAEPGTEAPAVSSESKETKETKQPEGKTEAKTEDKSASVKDTPAAADNHKDNKPKPAAEAKQQKNNKPAEKQNINRTAGERFEQRLNAAKNQQNQPDKKADQKAQKSQQTRNNRPGIEVREQTRPESERDVVTVVPKTATRVVDTRGTSGAVDLSKYDDKLDNFVPDSVKETRGGNQKVKKAAGAAAEGQNSGRGTQNNQRGGKGQGQNNPRGGQNGRDGGQNRRDNQQQNNRQNNNNQKGGKGQQQFGKGRHGAPAAPAAPVKKQQVHAAVPDEITVGDFAARIKVTSGEVIKRLMMMGMMVTVNQTIDFDTAYLVADELGAVITKEVVVSIEDKLFEADKDAEEDLVTRAPVVCVMGHVDHGKTSLLDAIRNTRVTAGEAGGITQHIGAYRVKINGKEITFLDTPGHEAFTAMRARGAQATDIAILVVAADDGIMPQTVEAINHAKAAGVEIIVAINKMDKPNANPDAIKQELTKYDLVPEEWGGDVMCVPVSALKHTGIDDLLENVLLIAEVKEYKANPNRRAKGIVIESKLDKGRGPVATILVQNGTLRPGDIVIAGTAVGRVRAMTDHTGRAVKTAGPSMPVEITGLDDVPTAGDEVNGVEDERMARELADRRRAKAKEDVFKANARANLNDLFAQISEGVKELNVIVKADVGGSAEAVKQSLEKISNDEVKVRVIHAAAGGITESDVMFAAASNAIIVGFNVRPDRSALDSAERQNVDIRTYRVIYDCIDEITAAMKGMLAPKFKEALLGHAEVRQVIHVPNVGFIAGSYIQDGKITRSAKIRVVRDGVVVYEDKIASLRRFKDDVREVQQGFECGIGLEKFNDLKTGDILEAFIMEEIAQ